MSNQWAERVTSHQVNERIAALSERLQRANDPNTSAEAVPYLRRAQSVINELRARIENSTPELIASSALDRTVQHLQNAEAELDSYFQNANRGHLDNADVHIDNVAVELRSLPPLPPSKESAAVVKAAKDYMEQIGSLERAARENLRSLASDIEGSATELGDVRQRLETLANEQEELRQQAKSDLDAKVSESHAAIDAKVSETHAAIDAQKARLDQTITQQQETFLAAQESRLNEFNQSQLHREGVFSEAVETLDSEARSNFHKLAKEAEALVESVRSHDDRAKQVLGFTAATKVAGAYIEEAADQKRFADTWRRVAVGIFIVLLVVAPFAVLTDPIGADSSAAEIVTYTVSRLPLLLGLTASGYAVQQSAQHRRREQTAQRLASELTTFRPFLAELPEPERQALISEASKRYYRGAEPVLGPQE